MSAKSISLIAKVHIPYLIILWLLLYGTSYIFMAVFHWGLFVSAPISSLISVGAGALFRRWWEKRIVARPPKVE